MQAEEELSRKKGVLFPEHPEAQSPEETRLMLHELRMHQIELKLQNEELQKSHAEMDAIRERYFDLYDLAPVGYCTVSKKKLILEANLTLAILLNVSRSALIQRPMSLFILNQDQDICYLLLKNLFETDEPQTCELRMMRRDGTSFWVRMEATTNRDTDGAPVGRIILSEITEQQAGEALRQSEEKYRNIYYHSVLGTLLTLWPWRITVWGFPPAWTGRTRKPWDWCWSRCWGSTSYRDGSKWIAPRDHVPAEVC